MADDNRVVVEIKELDKFTLWARPNKEPGARASKLCWCIRAGNPRITVYTNDKDDTERYGIIYAGMNPESFMLLLNKWKDIVAGPNDVKESLGCKFKPRGADGIPGEITLMTTVMIGKDKEGICWISLISADGRRPKIKFELKLSNYHSYTKADGTVITESEGSVAHTTAMIYYLETIYSKLSGDFREKQPYDPNRNNTPKPPANKTGEISFDDDITF